MSGIDCTISRKKRKSLAIHIQEGEVIIKAPLKIADSVIADFVAKKRDWIIKKLDAYFVKYHRFLQVLEFKEFIIHGEAVQYFFTKVKKVVFDDFKILMPESFNCDSNGEKLKKAIKKLYVEYAKQYLAYRLQAIADEFNFTYSGFAVSNAKTKWGSCDSKKHIRLNWRLVLLPIKLQNYVFFHELCHTYYLNHSQNYWNLLSKYLPNAKGLRKQLKEYAPLIKYLG